MRGRWLLAFLGGFGLGGCGLQAVGLLSDTGDGGADGASRAGPDAAAIPDGSTPPGDGGARDGTSAESSPVDVGVVADTALDTGHADEWRPDAGAADTGPADAAREAGFGSSIIITGGPYSLEDEDAGVCSINSDTAASFTINNDRTGPIDFDWIGYAPGCGETKYGTIGPGGSQGQSTYVTHVWRVTDTASKAFLGEFVLNAPGPYVVDVH
jgi:hypothetical protein